MKKKYHQNLSKIKKDFKLFLTSEEGKIVEKNALKLGVSLAVIAAILVLLGAMGPKDVQAECSAHSSHGSHGSHGSHSRGGWC